jgi:FAD-dependent urate hydroxylase
VAMVENIIVGAGPYGLSIAAHLRSAGIEHAILGAPMQSWRRHMPAGMKLKSERFASSLSDPEHRYTLQQFAVSRGAGYSPRGVPLPIADFIDYADWFRRHAVPDIWNAKLVRLRALDGGFELMLSDRTVTAKRVILATGHLAYQNFPEALTQHANNGRDFVSHSADHCDFARFAGRDVTVVGCGQSALETAALLHEAGANARVLARAPVAGWNRELDEFRSLGARLRWPESGIGPGWRGLAYSELPRLFRALPARLRQRIVATAAGPAGAWWLKERVIGKIPLLTSHRITDAAECNGRLLLTTRNDCGTSQIVTDHLIAATGYRVDIGQLTFLDPELRRAIETYGGAPVLNAVLESSFPGLHFVGLASAQTFGPVMRFVYGTKHAAPILAAHIRSRALRRSRLLSAAFGARTGAGLTANTPRIAGKG